MMGDHSRDLENPGSCADCGGTSYAHYGSCPRVAQTRVDHEAMLEALEKSRAAPATAYDRAQAELNQHLGSLAQMVTSLTLRLDRALSRIEQLERDIALDRAEAIKSEKRIEALELEVAKLQGPALIAVPVGANIDLKATHLGCGCPGPWCNGHQFSASPAAAYPPLSDEGT